jgi:parallel beta-helix repeat protein
MVAKYTTTQIAVWMFACLVPFTYARAEALRADWKGGTNGTCNGTNFSSPTGAFAAADVGKVIVISGDSRSTMPAGTHDVLGNSVLGSANLFTWDNSPLFTTVVAVNSGTSLTLADPCNPLIQGLNTAVWDMGTDNSAALQSCLQGGTCVVPSGTYLMSGPPTSSPPYNSEVTPPSNSQLLCNGATFVFPHHDDYVGVNNNGVSTAVNISFLTLIGVHDVTISGCTILGTNQNVDVTNDVGGSGKTIQSNFAILISAGAANNRLVGNTLRKGWSDGDIYFSDRIGSASATFQGASPSHAAPVNNVISQNTFSDCGFNGIAIISGNGNTIEKNVLMDCNIDIEPNGDSDDGPTLGNVIRGNTVQVARRPPAGAPPPGTGTHVPVSFQSCAVPSCDTTGGYSVEIRDNTFVGQITLEAYCAHSGSLGQIWTNNTFSANGETCKVTEPGVSGDANCASASACAVPQSHGTYVPPQVGEVLGLIDRIVLQ